MLVATDPGVRPAGRDRVTALGRLEPGQGVVDVGAPPGERVERLEVREGQRVRRGDTLAVLDCLAERRAERDARRSLLRQAELRLQRVREIGPLETEAQQAKVRVLRTELAMAETDLARYRELRDEELINEQEFEHQTTVTEGAREELRHAETLLERVRQQERIDRLEAEARIAEARARLAEAEARLGRATIRAPLDGQVLKILTWPGEETGQAPVLRMGDTARMYAVAEVYETDVRFLSVGRPVTVRSPALPAELSGTVEHIGSMIHKNDVLDVDPAAGTDARVVEVRARLDEHAVAARFVHLQVEVEIRLAGPEAGR